MSRNSHNQQKVLFCIVPDHYDSSSCSYVSSWPSSTPTLPPKWWRTSLSCRWIWLFWADERARLKTSCVPSAKPSPSYAKNSATSTKSWRKWTRTVSKISAAILMRRGDDSGKVSSITWTSPGRNTTSISSWTKISAALLPPSTAWETRGAKHVISSRSTGTREDVFKPLPKSGTKRQVNNFSINTDITVNSPVGQRVHSSSRYHHGVIVDHINVSKVVLEQAACAFLAVPGAAPPPPAAVALAPPIQSLVNIHTLLSISNMAAGRGKQVKKVLYPPLQHIIHPISCFSWITKLARRPSA